MRVIYAFPAWSRSLQATDAVMGWAALGAGLRREQFTRGVAEVSVYVADEFQR